MPDVQLHARTATSAPIPQPSLPALRIPPNNFDFLRLLFALLVIVSHSYVLFSEPAKTYAFEPLFRFTRGQRGLGHLAVAGFFTISGFLTTHSFLRAKSFLHYLLKRVLRIYPAFIAATLVGIFIVFPLSLWRQGTLASFAQLLTPRALLHAIRSCVMLTRYDLTEPFEKLSLPAVFAANPFSNNLNGSLWTIRYEFLCYLIMGLVGVLLLRKRRTLGTLTLALACLAAYITSAWWQPLAATPPQWPALAQFPQIFNFLLEPLDAWPGFLTYYFAGALVYLLQKRISFNLPFALAAVALLCFVARVPDAFNPILPTFLHRPQWLPVLEPILCTYILFTVAFAPWLPLRQAAKFGDFSYGIYLYAFPIQQLLVQYLHPTSGLALLALSAPLSILSGILSWHLLEKWFVRLKKKAAFAPVVPAPSPDFR